MFYSKTLVIIGLLTSSSPILAQGSKGSAPILSHPFQLKPSGLSLNARSAPKSDSGDQPLVELAPQDIAGAGLDPRFHLRSKIHNELNLYNDRKIESVSYGFDFGSVPVCDLEIKVHKTMDGLTTMMGDIPRAPEAGFAAGQWASDSQISKIIGETLLISSLGADFKVESKEKCLWSGEALKPAWKLTLTVAGGLNYEIVTDANEVFRFDPKHFHETGSATVFQTNINEGVPEPIALRDMDATGYLSNPYFQTCVPSTSNKAVCQPSEGSSPYAFANEPTFDFHYNAANDNNKFTQASIFAHTNVALEWLQGKGYANFGSTQIRLLAHAKIGGDVNNALYQPATSTLPPMILVGDGDGNILANLGTDADVVSHELGHHVIYNSVTTIAGESLVIHEALADFLTFSRTNNACLGESICTQSSIGLKVCAKPAQCLRSAENEYALGDANLPEQAHLKGQFISGLLWDLRTKDGIAPDDVTNMVLKAIDLLVSNSGYKHLIVGLLIVDHTEYQDKYCPTILARAQARGLGAILADVSCASIQASPPEGNKVTTYLSTESAATTAASSSKKGKKACGVLSGEGSGQAQSLLLILSLPIAITWIRRKKS